MAYGDPQFKKVFLPLETNLDRLADLIHYEYGGNGVDGVFTNAIKNIPQKRINRNNAFDKAEIEDILRSFKNAWYYEQYLMDLREQKLFDFGIPISISLLYHSFLCAASALIRITGHQIPESAGAKINCYNNLVKGSPQYSKYLLCPFNFYFDRRANTIVPPWNSVVTWTHGLKHKCPYIEEGFREISKTDYFSILNFLRRFREILQYQEAQVAAYMYGESVLREMKFSTRYLPYFFIGNIEVIFGLTIPGGFEVLKKEVESFNRPLESNFGIKLINPGERMKAYEKLGLDKCA